MNSESGKSTTNPSSLRRIGSPQQLSREMGSRWGPDAGPLFFSRFEHTLDDEGHLIIPAKYRAILATGVVITRGIDPCLCVYPLVRWEQLAENMHQLPMTRKDARRFALFMFAEAADCIPDKEGRMLIPPALRAYANLDHEVITIGVNDHLEIWNPDAYRQLNSRLEQDADSLAEKLYELGIL